MNEKGRDDSWLFGAHWASSSGMVWPYCILGVLDKVAFTVAVCGRWVRATQSAVRIAFDSRVGNQAKLHSCLIRRFCGAVACVLRINATPLYDEMLANRCCATLTARTHIQTADGSVAAKRLNHSEKRWESEAGKRRVKAVLSH